jgi:hypothetical protein
MRSRKLSTGFFCPSDARSVAATFSFSGGSRQRPQRREMEEGDKTFAGPSTLNAITAL